LIEEYGFTLLEGLYAVDVGFAEQVLGDLERAEHVLRRGHDVLLEIGDVGVRASVDGVLGDVLVLLGRDDEALAVADGSRAISAADDLDAQPRWRVARARVLSRRGEQDEALELLCEALELVEPTDFIELKAQVHDAHGEVLAREGRQDDAVAAVERAVALHEQKGNVSSARRSRAALDELRASRPS
jgi:tetratricopeptide (TPR) repeat protein